MMNRPLIQNRVSIAMLAMAACLAIRETRAAEWQWSVAIDAVVSPETGNHPRAFLWIPPDCRQVRAVVVGQHNMLEEGILEHPQFRREMARLGIAEIWITPALDPWQDATHNATANRTFDAMLKRFAAESGYGELESAPIIPIGHSAMASYPWNFAAWNPERTLAILSIKGDAPQTHLVGNGRPNVDWGDRRIDGIPGLMVMGEYEWWEDRLTPAFRFLAEHPGAPIAMLAEPGRGHFDSSDRLVRYLALFIRKAAESRLPRLSARITVEAIPNLKPVDPRNGWLVDRWRKDEKPHAPAASFAKYQGDASQAFWAFDREMARLTQGYGADQRGKQPQMIGYVQDGKVIPQTPDTHEQVRLKFLPENDGITFKLGATFLDAVAAGGNPPKWTGLTNGAPLGHSSGGGPIRITRICGPVRHVDENTFAIDFYRMGTSSSRRAGDIWFLAEHPGDKEFKSAVQQANLRIPVFLNEGAEQEIAFPTVPPVTRGTKRIKLNARSSAGVPVSYYVREGPAEVDGDTLRFTAIPPRAKFPVRVTVVAWQYGRRIEPKLQSAEPVERTFLISEKNHHPPQP